MNRELSTAFYQICLEEESTATIEILRNDALAQVKAGSVKVLTSTSINGKSLGFTVSASPIEILTAASWAIRQYNGQVIEATAPNFSGI